ncbi:Gldg family protein [Microcoleus sp. FACHB-831]|uniref:GldG family protein n=1 Tax=Microcoleus sp. FACHB-831 TaxID=2692827 RepID=UPI00168871CE|nr:Gldg family protein [Microcoleus sp. FACHB-831]MBD1924072.1 Gldg family protein [Microcoleus sp. FACHB-831]
MKQIKNNWKYLTNLFWLGPILTIMGLTAGFISGIWNAITLGLLISGLVIIGLWLVYVVSSSNGFWGKRSTSVGTNAAIASLSVVVILALVNFLATRYTVRVDFTENQLYTLAPETQQLVRTLQQPVKVLVFDRNQDPANRELLENYRKYNSQFSFEFVDPDANPTLAQKFGVGASNAGEVYLESGEKRPLVQVVNPGDRISEAKLTLEIGKILSDRTDNIYFLQGHGEHPLEAVQGGISQALAALKEKNYIVQPLKLDERLEIPLNAAAIVIAGPKRALFEAEVSAIRDYLQRGGSVLLMVDPNINPGLDTLLQEWGVKLDNRLIVDASDNDRNFDLGPVTPLVTRYGQHPITKDFVEGFSFYPLARPVDVTPITGIDQSPLLITSDQSWGESNPDKTPLEFNPQSDRQGPLAIGVALSRTYPPQTASLEPTPSPTSSPSASPTTAASPSPTPTPSSLPPSSPSASPTAAPTPSPTPTLANPNQKLPVSRLVVLGNSDFATDNLFDKQLNGDVFINSISWLSKRDEQVLSIRPKEVKNRRINMSVQQSRSLAWTALIIMPLVGFITALVTWWRRR